MTPETYKLLVCSMRNGMPPFSKNDSSRDASAQWLAFNRVFASFSNTLMADQPSRDDFRRDVFESR